MKKVEIVYQVIRDINEFKNVVVDIAYSGDLGADGHDILQFEYATISTKSNPKLYSDQIMQLEDALENGIEELVVIFLKEWYADSNIRFDIGEYKFNPLSILYDPKAK